MQKSFAFAFALSLLLTLSSCENRNHPACNSNCNTKVSNPNNNNSTTKNEKPSYLFVILSNHGQIQKASDGSYQLILDHGEIEKILAFSNRPYRIVKHMTGKELQTIWTEGANSFAEDPPNATVIINQHLQTIVLLNVKVVGDQTIFTIRADGAQSLLEMDGLVQLFVDMETYTSDSDENEKLRSPK